MTQMQEQLLNQMVKRYMDLTRRDQHREAKVVQRWIVDNDKTGDYRKQVA